MFFNLTSPALSNTPLPSQPFDQLLVGQFHALRTSFFFIFNHPPPWKPLTPTSLTSDNLAPSPGSDLTPAFSPPQSPIRPPPVDIGKFLPPTHHQELHQTKSTLLLPILPRYIYQDRELTVIRPETSSIVWSELKAVSVTCH